MAEDPQQRALVEGLRSGEPAIFREVYELYRPRVFSFLLRMCVGDRALAEDLLQETWIRAARGGSKLRDDTRLDAWLFTIARNLVVSHQRWSIFRAKKRPALKARAERSGRVDTPFDHATARETTARLESAIAALPPRHREALLLVAVDGMTPKSAAEVLGVAPATLRQRLKRARDALEPQLELAAQGTEPRLKGTNA